MIAADVRSRRVIPRPRGQSGERDAAVGNHRDRGGRRRAVAVRRRTGRSRSRWSTGRSTTTGRCPRASSSGASTCCSVRCARSRRRPGPGSALGRPLGEIRYLKEGLPKRVRYWVMPCARQPFVEGDRGRRGRRAALAQPQRRARAAHLGPRRARHRALHWPTCARPGRWSSPATAAPATGRRWDGDDTLRPLDEVGRGAGRACSARSCPATASGRCTRRTCRAASTRCPPTRTSVGVEVVEEPAMSEIGWGRRRRRASTRLVALARQRRADGGEQPARLHPGPARRPARSARRRRAARPEHPQGRVLGPAPGPPARAGGLPELVSVERFEPTVTRSARRLIPYASARSGTGRLPSRRRASSSARTACVSRGVSCCCPAGRPQVTFSQRAREHVAPLQPPEDLRLSRSVRCRRCASRRSATRAPPARGARRSSAAYVASSGCGSGLRRRRLLVRRARE